MNVIVPVVIVFVLAGLLVGWSSLRISGRISEAERQEVDRDDA